MLDRAHRLTRGTDFETAVRRGRRAGSGTLVAHLWSPDAVARARSTLAGAPPRVGFVVGRSVGDAVTRNRVKRRLRHLVRGRLRDLPAGGLLVVRALPRAGAENAALEADLDRVLARVLLPKEAPR